MFQTNRQREGNGSLSSKVNSLIRWQNTKSATSGFLTGLGGVITLPVAIPANIASVMYVQIRMIAAIAHMAGYDLRDDRVKTLVYTCLCGNAAKDIVKEFGIKIGTKLTETAIKKISAEVIVKINQAVGFRLLTKFGEKGVVNLGKAIPLVGGVIGGTMNGITTNLIGNVARDTFLATS
ncbi:EcsC family protein [Paenibacillus polymyxa]|uniref:EcsC family protein n=1 Tax=Paenibacillus polymyxa TaxID=1406 RepID=UPI003D2C2379